MMGNMDIYNACRDVPQEAKKTIGDGKLKGFTDINPMWRIAKLTEMFGACGVGWYVDILCRFLEEGKDGRVAAFVELNLYVKIGEDWSKPIYGIGGSMFTDMEKGNLVTSDEAFKMAYTDAISVACKALGMGADVYWQNGRSKYNQTNAAPTCSNCGKPLEETTAKDGSVISVENLAKLSANRFGSVLCADCMKKCK